MNLRREEEAERQKHADLCDRLAQLEEELETKRRLILPRILLADTLYYNFSGVEAENGNLIHIGTVLEDLKTEANGLRQTETSLVEQVVYNSHFFLQFLLKVRSLRIELETGRQQASQFESNNRLLKALMEQKQNGTIRGIFGRLV